MFNFLNTNFGIEKEAEIKISLSTTKIKSKKGSYIIKKINDATLESLFQRLDLSNIKDFLLPLRGWNNSFVQQEDDKYYVVYNYYKEDSLAGHDLKLSFYIKSIVNLHQKTKIIIKPTDHYFETTLNYLDEGIKKLSDALEARIEVIERSDYHSPNDWYFLMNYHYLSSAIESASRHVMNFEKEVKNIDGFRICITYQNFDFEHILLKNNKIISIEKMAYNFPGSDLYDLLTKLHKNSIKIEPYVEEYLKLVNLEEYEKEYLMAILFIFDYHRYDNDKDDLLHLINLVEYVKLIESIEENFIFSSPSEE